MKNGFVVEFAVCIVGDAIAVGAASWVPGFSRSMHATGSREVCERTEETSRNANNHVVDVISMMKASTQGAREG